MGEYVTTHRELPSKATDGYISLMPGRSCSKSKADVQLLVEFKYM